MVSDKMFFFFFKKSKKCLFFILFYFENVARISVLQSSERRYSSSLPTFPHSLCFKQRFFRAYDRVCVPCLDTKVFIYLFFNSIFQTQKTLPPFYFTIWNRTVKLFYLNMIAILFSDRYKPLHYLPLSVFCQINFCI